MSKSVSPISCESRCATAQSRCQELLEVAARLEAREAVLAQPGRQTRAGAVGILQPLARVAVVADQVRELAVGVRTGCTTLSFQNSEPSGR